MVGEVDNAPRDLAQVHLDNVGADGFSATIYGVWAIAGLSCWLRSPTRV